MSGRYPDDVRLEVKAVASDTRYHDVLHWVRMHRAGFREPYPERWVHNVYFDTNDYDGFSENLAGVSDRTKVRFRWYGQSPTPDAGTLEVKCKRNCFGWKLRFRVPEAPWQAGDGWRQVRESLLAQLPPAGRLWLEQNPLVVLHNSYYRKYFLTADGKVRLTIDRQLVARDQRFGPDPSEGRVANLPRCLIIEVKCHRDDRDVASDVVQDMPFRVSRHSKYTTAVVALCGG